MNLGSLDPGSVLLTTLLLFGSLFQGTMGLWAPLLKFQLELKVLLPV